MEGSTKFIEMEVDLAVEKTENSVDSYVKEQYFELDPATVLDGILDENSQDKSKISSTEKDTEMKFGANIYNVSGETSDAKVFYIGAKEDRNNELEEVQKRFKTSFTKAQDDALQKVSKREKNIVDFVVPCDGPRMYDTMKTCTEPLRPSLLPAAFASLPLTGAPKCDEDLKEFQQKKLKDFVGGNMTDEQFAKLKQYCSVDNLKMGRELTFRSPFPTCTAGGDYRDWTPGADSAQAQHLRTVRLAPAEKVQTHLKYRGVRFLRVPMGDPVIDKTPLEPGKDLIFKLRFYRPFTYSPRDHHKSVFVGRRPRFDCEVSVLGRHRLSVLRDRIACANDVGLRVDASAHPRRKTLSSAKELFPSGFLFINNVFYNDQRAGCIDYSEPIREWAAKRNLGDFPARNLDDYTFEQLDLRIGHVDLYMHQGNCEHLFTVSEVRLVNSSDILSPAAYPAVTAASQHQATYCTTCAEFFAVWLVVGCDRVPFDPAYFCGACFEKYLYIKDQKLGNFQAYPLNVSESASWR